MASNKTVWTEGMYLAPQHFQQQERFLESHIHSRCESINPYAWGIHELVLDTNMLKLGKLSISKCRAIFPDGTVVNIPEDDEAPAPLSVPPNLHNQEIFLTLPFSRAGVQAVSWQVNGEGETRYHVKEVSVKDGSSDLNEMFVVQSAVMNLNIKMASQDLSGYAAIGIARIKESKEDKQVILDDMYIPTCADIQSNPRFKDFLKELYSLLKHRGEALAGRLLDSGRSGSAEIADYMLLQLVNRLEPMVQHLQNKMGLHPEALYYELIQMAGELSTFTSSTKRPPQLVTYLHEKLAETYEPVFKSLRQNLSMVMEQSAVSLELVERKYGIYVSPITDRSLLKTSTFVIAVSADIPAESLRKIFPAQVKLAPVEKIRQIVNAALPGISMQVLPVAPRQIPYHAGMTYFELDSKNEYWTELQQSGGFAMHVGGEFPGLKLEFWAIRQ